MSPRTSGGCRAQGRGGLKHDTISTPRRRDEVLAFIIDRLVKTGTSPSYFEIGQNLRPKVGTSRAQELVNQLIADGVLEKTPGAVRALRVRDVVHAREIVEQQVKRRPVRALTGQRFVDRGAQITARTRACQ